MSLPFNFTRPVEYAPIPRPVRSRRGAGGVLPPGPRTLPGALTVRFLKDTPAFLRSLLADYGETSCFFLNGQLFYAFFSPEAVIDVTVKRQHSFIKGVGSNGWRRFSARVF